MTITEKDLDRLYEIKDRLKDSDEKATVTKVIFILEQLQQQSVDCEDENVLGERLVQNYLQHHSVCQGGERSEP